MSRLGISVLTAALAALAFAIAWWLATGALPPFRRRRR
jgi:hypothetical protein